MNNLLKKVSAVLLIVSMTICSGSNLKMNKVEAADTVLTSSEISVTGYQIKTNVTPNQGISFRAVCKAPVKGSVITVGDEEYTVTNVGTIYTKDINTSGNNDSNVLNKSYTELDPTPFPSYAIKDGYGFKYVGKKDYLNNRVTFGYIATDEGITKISDGYVTYTRTLTNMDAYVRNSIFVRAFVEATDAQGNEVLIYGEYASITSVAEIAYKVYMESKAPNIEGHNYIFDAILNKLPATSPFYKKTPEEFGWGGVVNP